MSGGYDGQFGFTDRIEFSSTMDELSTWRKEKQRAELQEQVDAYIRDGGTIQVMPYSPIQEILARVGRWVPMGDDDEGKLIGGEGDTYED